MSDLVRNAISKSLADFSLKLYSELIEPNDNLFISPYSIFTALAMVYAGAREITEAEMSKVLHLDIDQDILHPTIKENMDKLLSYKEIELNIANSLWIQEGYKLIESYLALIRKNYAGSVYNEDFNDASAAVAKINSWVSDKTNEKITDVVNEGVLKDVVLLLINAIYFKAKWASQFTEHYTRAEEFTLLSGERMNVRMMHDTTSLDYLDEGSYCAIKKPYKGYETSMIIYLPKKLDGIVELEKQVQNIKIIEQISRFTSQKIRLSLPKFKIETEYKLLEHLSILGMKQVFTEDSDLSGMTDHTDDIRISEVIHKTFIEVEEWGTEAAAVTILPGLPAGAPPTQVEPPIDFRVDHPFLFLIYDSMTKSILFMGRIMRPTETSDKAISNEELMAREAERLRNVMNPNAAPPPPPPSGSFRSEMMIKKEKNK